MFFPELTAASGVLPVSAGADAHISTSLTPDPLPPTANIGSSDWPIPPRKIDANLPSTTNFGSSDWPRPPTKFDGNLLLTPSPANYGSPDWPSPPNK